MNLKWKFLILAGTLVLFPCGKLPAQEKALLEGLIDNKHPIKMLIYSDGNTVRGNYLYRKVGTLILIGGTITADGVADMQEWDGKGNQTGTFRGRFALDRSFNGQWVSPKGKSLSAVLTPSKETDDEFFPSSVDYSLTPFSGIQKIQTIRISGGNAQVVHDLNNLLSVSKLSGESEDEIRNKFATQEYPQGLVSMTGEVTCNKHHVFSATISQEALGAYLSSWSTHINYDLRRGKKLTIGDLLDMEKVDPLVEQLRDEFQRRALESIEAASKDGNDISHIKDRVFQEADLDNFSVKEDMGLRFYFSLGLPHVLQLYSPDESYGIDFEGLGKYIKRDGPLWPLVREQMGF